MKPEKGPTAEDLIRRGNSGRVPARFLDQRDPGDETDAVGPFTREAFNRHQEEFKARQLEKTDAPEPAEKLEARLQEKMRQIRQFDTGATRNVDSDELDYHGFLSPLVRKRFAEYMHEHRIQADGTLRSSDNWQKGIPIASYCSSLVRHVTDAELCQDKFDWESREGIQEALCAVIFNAQGWLFELLKEEYKAKHGQTG